MAKDDFWLTSLETLLSDLNTSPSGLSHTEASLRLKTYGPNSLTPPHKYPSLRLLFSQFKSPLILLLICAAILSLFLRSNTDAVLILSIVFFSGLLGFFQERGAVNALAKMLQLVEIKASILRDNKEEQISLADVVPGDVVILRSGDIVPADCVLLEEKNLFIDESTLTGESAPVEKSLNNPLFMGTMVSSGAGKALIVVTGRATEYGHITERSRFRPPETAFEIGIRQVGYFLLVITLILTSAIFLFNLLLHHPLLDSFMFSLALAVGLTPQLLPAIISVNLAHGARKMAKQKVIVKRLASIENFGQMNVLCSDKTGTITEGKIQLDRAVDVDGHTNEKVALYAYLSAHFQTTYVNPLDQSILEKFHFDVSQWTCTGEIPYDFTRKRLSVICNDLLIAKGSVPQILQVCNLSSFERDKYEKYFEEQSGKGYRSLALAMGPGPREENLTLMGFIHFFDPLKPGIAQVVADLKGRGVQLKIITGDHHSVAAHIASGIGMSHIHMITGDEVRAHSEDLARIVKAKNVFAEINPTEKEGIVLALKKAGFVVGYLGDGINDIDAMQSADVSITVDSGADAAKECADIVLLEKDLCVLKSGIDEGRRTFANTLKYVCMATSANFGNMFSMAGASLFLPFLPLLPKQVLMVNFLTDLPEMAIATDQVDNDVLQRAAKWDLRIIGKFMIVFGLISSIFDYATFGVLLYWLKAEEPLFQSGWFVESVVSATLAIFAIRTHRAFFSSRPGSILTVAILSVATSALFIPLLPIFGFVPLPWGFYGTLAGLLSLYLLSLEVAKRLFYRHR